MFLGEESSSTVQRFLALAGIVPLLVFIILYFLYNKPIVMSPFTLAVKWISTSRSSSMLILKLFFFSPSET